MNSITGIHRHPRLIAIVFAVGVIGISSRSVPAQEYEQEPINYGKGLVRDRVTQLQEKLDSGSASLEFDERFGYLPSVLAALDVETSSQTLVFSKTSFQQKRISPNAPRALYFSDDVYVGWVQRGDVVEVSSVDPQQGAMFYSLRQRKADKPSFIRHTHECLQCHGSSLTRGIPGHIVRSVYPDATGFPILGAGTFITDHTSPFAERWGGWYVTGTHGKQRHMGNVFASDKDNPNLDLERGANVSDLSQRFRTAAYLTPHSDIVAQMVLEHQTQMHNQITAANYATRRALHDNSIMNGMLDRPPDEISDSTKRRLARAGERLLKCLLFVDEAELTHQVAGTSDFAREFTQRGPRDSQGRSLRDFDLEKQLFRYPCSFLIYSEAFNALPDPLKDIVYRRLREILTGADDGEEFAHLSATDRQAILDILRATKSDLPPSWSLSP